MISPALLIEGYLRGVFPMGMEDGEIGWFSPDPRAIIPLDDLFHVPHGLKRTLHRGTFQVRMDHAFEPVMRACAGRKETWITEEIIESYCELHRRGCAHSVEAWHDDRLAGGLYGVAIGGAFFGESMFHCETDASKVALHALVQHLRERGFKLLDTQWITPHLRQFGAMEISRRQYLRRLAEAIHLQCSFT
jgi:leucyl/phenylalanyl-tRNA--protein transferase